jgi:cytochrome P450/nitrite reductase/ring-hydroxylating ferredoxin subunit
MRQGYHVNRAPRPGCGTIHSSPDKENGMASTNEAVVQARAGSAAGSAIGAAPAAATKESAAATSAQLTPIPGADRLEGEGPYAVAAGGQDLILLRTPGGVRVYQGRCPHQGALLGEGELEADTLVCRNHRWRFNVSTGKRQGGPQCLVACPVVEQAGQLLVDLAPLAVAEAPSRARRRVEDLPGPKGLPVLGNALQLELPRLHEMVEAWATEFGPLFLLRLAAQRTVVISDPALAQEIFRARPETYRRTQKLERVFDELGVAGVFSSEGVAWRSQRRLAMEALSHRHLRGFYPTLHLVADRLRRRWEGAADRHEILDVVEELKRFTVDVTTALTFGHDVNTIEQESGDIIQRRLELLFPAFNERLFALIPLWRVLRLPKDRRLDRARAELGAWLEGLVGEARTRLAADPSRAAHPANFLEAMLAMRDDAGQPFSNEVIFGNLVTMLLAGEDTTAFTLAWAVHQMCESPESVAGLRAELDATLGQSAVPADIEAANRLAYAGGVANESMRLRPVAPVIMFEAAVDTTIDDVEIPAGTYILILTRPPARDPAHFADPEQFRPERWIEPTGAHEPSAYFPFGSGPRICPGRSLALLEMKVVLAMLYKNFEVIRQGRAADVRELFAFTMGPAGLRVQLRRRVL